jgi:predicted RNA-binding protein with PIN domain
MFWLDLVLASVALLVTPTTWLIDGNNLKGQRPVPSNREDIKSKLEEIFMNDKDRQGSTSSNNVVLIFDGRKGESPFRHKQLYPVENDGGEAAFLEVIITTDGQSADDFMLEWLKEEEKEQRVKDRIVAVTADKELQQLLVLEGGLYKAGGSIVHPLKFWVNVLPRLIELPKRTGKKSKRDSNAFPQSQED